VDIFDMINKVLIKQIKIKNIKDFMQDDITAKIYSIDVLDNHILITSQGDGGYINIYLYDMKNDSIKKIIDVKDKLFIRKAKFIDNTKIIIATLSNEIILYDLKAEKMIYKHQISMSSFSDFALNESKNKIVSTDESGEVKIYKVDDFQLIKKPENKNLDRVFQLSYKNNTIVTAGQDRKSVLYINNNTVVFEFDFLLYACALNSNASLFALSYNEDNDVLIIDTKTKEKLYALRENKANITKIVFKNKNTIIVSSNDNKINIYRINR
jgi:hypothetical protein